MGRPPISASASRPNRLYSGAVRTSAVVALFWIVIPTFAASKLPDYPETAARKCLVSSENGGITIGLTPVEDPQDQKTYFHANLARKGFVPVFFVIENRTSTNVLLFDKTRITYGPASSAVPTTQLGPGAGKMVALSLIPIAGPLAAAQIVSAAALIRQNLMKKEIQSTTLSPGASAHGFLYIPIPKRAPRGKIALRVPLGKAATNETFDLNLVF